MSIVEKKFSVKCQVDQGLFKHEKVATFLLGTSLIKTVVSDESLIGKNIFLNFVKETTEHFVVKVPGDLLSGDKYSVLPKSDGIPWFYQRKMESN